MTGYLETADDVDAVIVATPSGTHADMAVPALEAGEHALIEKPLDITLGAADRIIAAERAGGRIVGVIAQHRWDRSSRRVPDAVARGGMGRLPALQRGRCSRARTTGSFAPRDSRSRGRAAARGSAWPLPSSAGRCWNRHACGVPALAVRGRCREPLQGQVAVAMFHVCTTAPTLCPLTCGYGVPRVGFEPTLDRV